MRIVVDAMGSDDHPGPDVAGAVLAARRWGDTIILTGDEALIRAELAKQQTRGLAIEVQHASQAVTMHDQPSAILRQKPDSSVHVGLGLVRDKSADAFVSAGNTGATLAVSMLQTLKRIRGIKRPALAVTFPTPGAPLLIDNGANTDCQPEHLAQFGLMGSLYMQHVRGIARPRVCLISNGEEAGKGNQQIKETIPLLAASGLNFVGNLEPRDFMQGGADVAVTDGFLGNVMIKTAEAIARVLLQELRSELLATTRTKIGAALAKPAFDRVRSRLSPDAIGGAPLLGVNGVVIVAHGHSSPRAIEQAIGQARHAVSTGVVEAIRAGIAQHNALFPSP
jgi:glycerol-3-phosphate acyltransferase PlsX